jgi:epoxyqueuosine reductase
MLGIVEGGLSTMSDTGARMIEKAKAMGAATAGIASLEHLSQSPSHQILREIPDLSPNHSIKWPGEAKSALVIAVSHPRDKPELDWWGLSGSPGKRILTSIKEELSLWVEGEFDIKAHLLNYSVVECGAYLKDAAVLAGLGCIGKNNLLVTPEFGPRVRLDGMLLEEELPATGPIDFDPCDGCKELCRKACPQDSYGEIVLSPVETGMAALPGRDGRFSRGRCMVQMEKNVADGRAAPQELSRDVLPGKGFIKYCRRCELACPVGS